MRFFVRIICCVIVFSVGQFASSPARAQNYGHTFIAATGNDANSCIDSNNPCRTFSRAYNQVAPRGMITCLTPGDWVSSTISKSLKVDCEGTFASFSVQTGSGDVVILHGVKLDSNSSGSGISFSGSGTLILDRISFADPHGPQVPIGINFAPTGPSKLIIVDSVIVAAGAGTTGGGVIVKPTGSGSAIVSFEHVNVGGNVFGVAFDGSQSTAGINATIADSMISGNSQDGIVATTTPGHAPIGVMVKNTKSANNAYGIRSIGPNVTIRVDGSTITGNGTGIAALSGGSLLTLHTNVIRANGNDGAFTGSLALQ